MTAAANGVAASGLPALSIVVPLLDEEENLARYEAELFPGIDRLGLAWELVAVDDGSRDGSRALAARLAAARGGAPVVVHESNRGLGAAVRSGIAAARGELVVTLDADLTFHPRDVGRLLERYRRGDVDLVLGAPAAAGFAGVAWHRAALSQLANRLYQLALGRRLTAVTPIFRLYRAALLRDLELESNGFAINAEILAKLLLRGARVAEVPTPLTTRVHGVSKLNSRAEIMNHLRLIARIVGWRRKGSAG